jgi:hypothetical protein
MRVLPISIAAVCLLSGVASATIDEVEPNNSLATAQVLPFGTPGSEAVLGSLTPGDVDFYSVDLVAGHLFTANIFDFTPGDDTDNDSVLALFDSDGDLIALDDDGGPGFLSVLFLIVPETGTYTIGVTGFPDFDFVGDHGEDFIYKLVINRSVPAPATLALLAAGVAVGRRRRS